MKISFSSNSALCELLGLEPELITKATLYQSTCRLYALHHKMEKRLSNQVCALLGVENKILLFNLTNSYFEGRMQGFPLDKYGRTKEKHTDCKQIVLAVVVNIGAHLNL